MLCWWGVWGREREGSGGYELSAFKCEHQQSSIRSNLDEEAT